MKSMTREDSRFLLSAPLKKKLVMAPIRKKLVGKHVSPYYDPSERFKDPILANFEYNYNTYIVTAEERTDDIIKMKFELIYNSNVVQTYFSSEREVWSVDVRVPLRGGAEKFISYPRKFVQAISDKYYVIWYLFWTRNSVWQANDYWYNFILVNKDESKPPFVDQTFGCDDVEGYQIRLTAERWRPYELRRKICGGFMIELILRPCELELYPEKGGLQKYPYSRFSCIRNSRHHELRKAWRSKLKKDKKASLWRWNLLFGLDDDLSRQVYASNFQTAAELKFGKPLEFESYAFK